MRLLCAVFPVFFLALLCSCEMDQEMEQTICLPASMSATIIQGTNTTKVIADFHYIPGTDLIDHITWSNHQTHTFEYYPDGRLKVVRQLKVNEKVQDEIWFVYEGEKVRREILVRKNLDYVYLEPVDSSFTGHIEFIYDDGHIVSEKQFKMEDNLENLESDQDYSYDAAGNILSRTVRIPGSETETVLYTYDANKHPYSGIYTYFTGESFVNNPLTKSSGYDGLDYRYEVRANAYGYPESVYETLGSTNTRIIRYTYTCE